jgi:hypothetical protein
MKSDLQQARKIWDAYTAAMDRGHSKYQKEAKLCENYYRGGGHQWEDQIKEELAAQGKPWLEANIIFSTINTILGYQTQSRMDIAYKPREDSDLEDANMLSKIAMYEIDQNRYPWVESQVFSDGIIQKRGYFDVRMDFETSISGNISIIDLDPLDVIPDPDAKTYDSNKWKRVFITKWIPLDDVKVYYPNKYRSLLRRLEKSGDPDWGVGDEGEERNKFGDVSNRSSYYIDEAGNEYVRIIEMQEWRVTNRNFFVSVERDELIPVPDNLEQDKIKSFAKDHDYEVVNRVSKRIRWIVSTRDCVLYDDWSPYEFITIVPYFPYFRRGITVGAIDNLIKNQDLINKVYSQILHVVNTTANSGWIVEENSLTNMDTSDLERDGANTGLVIEHKMGRPEPKKIEPNPIPSGLKDLFQSSLELSRLISGVSESFQGQRSNEISGQAIQTRIQQAAVQLATPLDNLFRTRNMVAERILQLIQQFYTEEKTFRIISEDDTGNQTVEEVTINKEMPDGISRINDITVGKYDVVIADVPTQVTFQNAQFQQALEMRKYGIAIPDHEMVRMSTLARRNQIAESMANVASSEEQARMQEQMEAMQEELEAKIDKLESEKKATEAKTLKVMADIAKMVADQPAVSPILSQLMDVLKFEVEPEKAEYDALEEKYQEMQSSPLMGQPQMFNQPQQMTQEMEEEMVPNGTF